MNLMILSVGRRCELVKYFRKELNKNSKKVIAVDMSKYAPALYCADKFYVLKKDFNNLKKYINDIIKICKSEKVDFLLTFIDPELELLSRYRGYLKENSINLILSDDYAIENTINKYLFYLNYKGKLNLVKTFKDFQTVTEKINTGELKFPIIAKPMKASASKGIQRISDKNELEAYQVRDNYIFQEYIFGKEIGVDVYFDMVSGEIVSVFMKEKIAMRAGETDKSISLFRKDIMKEILKLKNCGGFKGPLDVDVFVAENGNIYLNEINARFGGGYPHAHYCGVNFMELMANNINGIKNETRLGHYPVNVLMMKYYEYLFQNGDNVYEA